MNHNEYDDENIQYWKIKYEELNIQYDEYQKQSAELENELEIQLKQSEDRIRDLENKNNRLNIDNETLKNKLNEVHTFTHKQISHLQEELVKSNAVKDEMHKYIRELEQKNDDLERTNRCAMFSLAEFESKINDALERNAILESELDEKDELAETVQRLRDESRDLRQELAVRQKKDYSFTNPTNLDISSNESIKQQQQQQQHHNQQEQHEHAVPYVTKNNINITQLNTVIETNVTNDIQINNDNNQKNSHIQSQISLKASSRISALNYVGDVLRKITSMESKLLASRNFIKDPNKERRLSTFDKVKFINVKQ